MAIIKYLEKKSGPFNFLLGLVLIGIIGILDFLTGREMAFSLFYLIPASLMTWLLGRQYGLIASIISALVWIVADAASGSTYSHPLVPVWNTLVRFAFFAITTWLLSAVKHTLEKEIAISHTDYLTGALNSRSFYALIEAEIQRSQRLQYPFTLVYIDLDNFKSVNDEFGHKSGDEVLRAFTRTAREQLRKTDIIARIGGDEFALLLPGTVREDAGNVLPKLQRALMVEMQQFQWPITFSMGAVTCNAEPQNAEELIRTADKLMYSVKRSGKNAIAYATYRAG